MPPRMSSNVCFFASLIKNYARGVFAFYERTGHPYFAVWAMAYYLRRMAVWIRWYSIECFPWRLLRYELFSQRSSKFPEWGAIRPSYWPGDIPSENIITAAKYRKIHQKSRLGISAGFHVGFYRLAARCVM